MCRLYPLDKAANADGLRRTLEPLAEVTASSAPPAPAMPPLLAKLLAAQADTGLPPAYLPKDERAIAAPTPPDSETAAREDGGAS